MGNYIYNSDGLVIGRISGSMSFEEYCEAILSGAGYDPRDMNLARYVKACVSDEGMSDFVIDVMRMALNDRLEAEGNWPEQVEWWLVMHTACCAANVVTGTKSADSTKKGIWT